MVTVDVESATVIGWANIARNLGVSKSTAKDWERRLGLPVRRMGGMVYVDGKELYNWKVAENNRRRKMREILA